MALAKTKSVGTARRNGKGKHLHFKNIFLWFSMVEK